MTMMTQKQKKKKKEMRELVSLTSNKWMKNTKPRISPLSSKQHEGERVLAKEMALMRSHNQEGLRELASRIRQDHTHHIDIPINHISHQYA
jgi:hypothetical protein